MRVLFLFAGKDEDASREEVLADAFVTGVNLSGDKAVAKQLHISETADKYDAVCLVGVKCAKHARKFAGLGKHVIFFDKGYTRHRGPARTWEYWRVSVDHLHPTEYVTHAKHSSDRWDALAKTRKIRPAPWSPCGPHILVAGSSAKFHAFYDLPDPTSYAKGVIRELKQITDRPIIYRPKPTWKEATPIKGAVFSPYTESITACLERSWCLVTHGSNATFEAAISGIPSVVIGEAIAKPISSQYLHDVLAPYHATDEERNQWFSNVAWCQFTQEEMATGLAWKTLRPQLED